MKNIEFRIRMDDKILGYEKWYPGKRSQSETMQEGSLYWKASPCWLYSVDGESWIPGHIFHNHKDAYTGLKDCKGQSAFHRDIVAFAGYSNWIIEWHKNGWKLKQIGVDHYVEIPDNPDDFNIFANAHENPELLEKIDK